MKRGRFIHVDLGQGLWNALWIRHSKRRAAHLLPFGVKVAPQFICKLRKGGP